MKNEIMKNQKTELETQTPALQVGAVSSSADFSALKPI